MDNGIEEDKKWWIDIVKHSLEELGLRLTAVDAENRAEWRRRTRVANASPEGFTAWRKDLCSPK